MKKRRKPHGGPRPRSGRPPKPQPHRVKFSVTVEPETLDLLDQHCEQIEAKRSRVVEAILLKQLK